MSGISRSWMAYRRIRQHFEANKVHVTALRILMATVYLPGTPGAFPGLPNDFTPVQKVAYAISRASNPQDILPFLVQSPPTPAVLAVWEWGRHRGDVCEQILVGIAELGGDFVPFHDVVCIAVECAKVLMEMEAVAIVVKRSGKALDRGFRIPTWFYLMKQVSQVLRGIGQLTADDEEGSISIPKGCSNLVGSMVRMAAEWAKTLEAEEAAAPSGSMAEDPQQPVKAPYWNGNGYGQDVGNNCQHQRYMNTSDRWMATDHNAHGGSYSQSPAEWQAAYPPTAIDLLLSEMFNYSSQPQGQPVSAQALSGGHSGQVLGYGKAPK